MIMKRRNSASGQRRGMSRTVPLLGITSQLDDGTWLATALDGREYGPFRFRPEACEVLLLVAPFPDAMTADRTREAT
jgi:hypothetical protein